MYINIILSLLMANPGPPSAEKIGFSVIGGGMTSAAKSETLCLCRDEKQLKKTLEDMGITEEVQWPRDLGKGVVIVAFLGQRRTAGYAIEPVAVYSVFYNDAGVDGESIWNWEIKPMLSQDGLDTLLVPIVPIEDVGDAVLVAKEKCPPKGAMLAQVITSPFIILSLKYTDLKNIYLSMVACGGGQ